MKPQLVRVVDVGMKEQSAGFIHSSKTCTCYRLVKERASGWVYLTVPKLAIFDCYAAEERSVAQTRTPGS